MNRTIYERLIDLRPGYAHMTGRQLAEQNLACPEALSEQLLGYEGHCEAETKKRSVCVACQMQFLRTRVPENG